MIKRKALYMIAALLGSLVVATLSSAAPQVIPVRELKAEPKLDGLVSDWEGVKEHTISVAGALPTKVVYLKMGTYKSDVFLLVRWADTTEDLIHRPYVWDEKRGKYEQGDAKEDRLAIEFAISGDYTTQWDSGKEFKSDMWYWKSSRSNPLGFVHDKLNILSKESSKQAYRIKAKDGSLIYLSQPTDSGSKLYHEVSRPEKKEQAVMPKYVLDENPTGSIADIKAKGVWRGNQWVVEMRRKLNTGNNDDVAFKKGAKVKGGVAIFDHSENEVHNISDTLIFQF